MGADQYEVDHSISNLTRLVKVPKVSENNVPIISLDVFITPYNFSEFPLKGSIVKRNFFFEKSLVLNLLVKFLEIVFLNREKMILWSLTKSRNFFIPSGYPDFSQTPIFNVITAAGFSRLPHFPILQKSYRTQNLEIIWSRKCDFHGFRKKLGRLKIVQRLLFKNRKKFLPFGIECSENYR